MREVEHRVESYDALLKEQSIDISRKAIDRVLPTMDVPPPRTEGLTTIISVVEEVLVVEKRLRLKEEIHITVIEEHRHQVGEVELREEKVKVERFESDPT